MGSGLALWLWYRIRGPREVPDEIKPLEGREREVKIITALAAALCLAATLSTMALAIESIPQADNFESYALGTYLVTSAQDGWGDSATTDANRYTIIEKSLLDGNANNQVAHIVDKPQAAANTHLRTNFWSSSSQFPTSGIYDVIMDICPLQTNGAFKIAITNGGSWTSGTNWLAAVGFGSDGGNTFFPGMTTGNHFGTQSVAGTGTVWLDTPVSYSANTWYTLRFSMNPGTAEYRAFVGERGGTATELTTGWTHYILGLVSNYSLGGFYIATSNKPGEGAELLLDNVRVVPEPSSLMALAFGGMGLIGFARRRKS